MPTTEELLQRKRELLQQKKDKLIEQQSLLHEEDKFDIGAARMTALTQGVTAGFSDELGALGQGTAAFARTPGTLGERSAAFILDRDASMADSKFRRNELREQFPKTTMGFEGLGGLVQGGATFRAASPLLNQMNPLQRAAGVGVAEGALFGAGMSDPGERLGGAAQGAAFGGLGGPLLTGAGVTAMRVLRPTARRLGQALFGKPRDRAVKEIMAALDADDLTKDEAFILLRSMGKNATFADLGDTLGRQGRLVTSELGPSASQAKRFLDARQTFQQRELMAAARRATGTSDYDKGIIELINGAESKAGPIYDEVFSEILDVNPVMLDLLKRPAMQGARKKAAIMLRNEGFSSEIASDITDVRYMDTIKRALDDQIGVAKRQGNNNQARILTKLKNEFVGEIDAQVPRYAEARSIFAGEQNIKEAADFGRTMFAGNKVGVRDAAEAINNMGESELRAARVGFLDWMSDELGKTSIKRNTLANKFSDVPKFRDMMSLLFPDQEAVDGFLREASTQARFAQTKNLVTGGSPTARIAADRDTLNPGLLRVASDAAFSQLNGISSALRLISGNTKLTPEVLEEMGKILFDPKIVPRQLRPNRFMAPFMIPRTDPSATAGIAGGLVGSQQELQNNLIGPLQKIGLLGQ